MKKEKSNTIYVKKSKLDQFYTSEDTAKKCYELLLTMINQKKYDLFFEPSAGTGSFYNLFPTEKKYGIDLCPKVAGIKKLDFFEYKPPTNKKILVCGNPPFGKNSSLAVKFFNRCAEFAEIIAFIVPKTFKKQSLQNKLDLNFKLIYSIDLTKNCFILNNEAYDVPCCFQIWESSKDKRKIKKIKLDNPFFDFTSKNNANFAIRRVGGRAGKAFKIDPNLSESSNYFLKSKDNIDIDWLINQINLIDFSKVTNSTAGVRSLSKQELIQFIKRKIK